MNWKVLASLAMPILTAALLGGVLASTHHRSLAIPSLARPTASPSPGVVKASVCASNFSASRPFSGVAVSKISADAIYKFTSLTKKPISLIEFYSSFPSTFNEGGAMSAVNLGAIPLLQLDPGVSDWHVIRQIANGVDDQAITAYANAVKEFGYCIVISFGHEMNGWWYPWGMPHNTPKTFIKAWRHVHDLFVKAGADNVIWSWDPSHQYTEVTPGRVASPASEWYPGNKYVDWVGLDGYLSSDYNGTPQNFDEIFAHQIASVRSVAPHKLLYLAETAVSPLTGVEPQQITELFAGIKREHMAGLVWFDENKKQNWKLTAKMKGAIAAYARGVSKYPLPKLINVPGQ